jgi:hypothetical protein
VRSEFLSIATLEPLLMLCSSACRRHPQFAGPPEDETDERDHRRVGNSPVGTESFRCLPDILDTLLEGPANRDLSLAGAFILQAEGLLIRTARSLGVSVNRRLLD